MKSILLLLIIVISVEQRSGSDLSDDEPQGNSLPRFARRTITKIAKPTVDPLPKRLENEAHEWETLRKLLKPYNEPVVTQRHYTNAKSVPLTMSIVVKDIREATNFISNCDGVSEGIVDFGEGVIAAARCLQKSGSKQIIAIGNFNRPDSLSDFDGAVTTYMKYDVRSLQFFKGDFEPIEISNLHAPIQMNRWAMKETSDNKPRFVIRYHDFTEINMYVRIIYRFVKKYCFAQPYIKREFQLEITIDKNVLKVTHFCEEQQLFLWGPLTILDQNKSGSRLRRCDHGKYPTVLAGLTVWCYVLQTDATKTVVAGADVAQANFKKLRLTSFMSDSKREPAERRRVQLSYFLDDVRHFIQHLSQPADPPVQKSRDVVYLNNERILSVVLIDDMEKINAAIIANFDIIKSSTLHIGYPVIYKSEKGFMEPQSENELHVLGSTLELHNIYIDIALPSNDPFVKLNKLYQEDRSIMYMTIDHLKERLRYTEQFLKPYCDPRITIPDSMLHFFAIFKPKFILEMYFLCDTDQTAFYVKYPLNIYRWSDNNMVKDQRLNDVIEVENFIYLVGATRDKDKVISSHGNIDNSFAFKLTPLDIDAVVPKEERFQKIDDEDRTLELLVRIDARS